MACDFTLQVYPGLSWHIIFTGRYSSELLSCLPNNIDSARIMCVFQLVVIKMESHQRRLNRTATESLIPVLWGEGEGEIG